MPLWNRIRLLLLFTLAWLILVWAAMADNPLLPFVDSVRIQLHESQWLIWLAGARAAAPGPLPRRGAVGPLPPVLVAAGLRRHRPRGAPADVGLDPVPAGPHGQDRPARRAVRGRRWRKVLDTSPVLAHLPGAGADLPGAAADPAAGVRVLLHRVPVHRPVLVAVPRRRRHVLPGRHQDPVHRRVGPGPRASTGSGRTSSTWRTPTRSRPRAATCPAASCCGGRPAPARR